MKYTKFAIGPICACRKVNLSVAISRPLRGSGFPARLRPAGYRFTLGRMRRARIDSQSSIPEVFGLVELLGHPSRLHEQMVAEAIDVGHQELVDRLLALQNPAHALGAPADRARL